MLRKTLIAFGLLVAVLVVAFFGFRLYRDFVQRRDAEERAASPQGQLPESAEPLAYRLHLRLDPSEQRFSGTARIEIEILEPTDVLWIHGKDLEATEVTLTTGDGTTLSPDYREMGHSGVVRLSLGEEVQPQNATLEIDYRGRFNKHPEGLFRVEEGTEHYAFTDFEPLNARRAFPGFDEPRFKIPYELIMDVHDTHQGFANSPLVAAEPLEGGFKRLRFATSKPLPSYLVAFAVGDFDVVEWEPIPPSTVRSDPLPLRGIARRGKGSEMTFALANTAPIVMALEEYFGIAHPYAKLDLVAVPEFAAGAMENPGLITYQEYLLLLGDDPPPEWQRRYGGVHAHELAHQWHGNLVTMPWWDDIWLNEAFATWLGYKIAARWEPDFEFGRTMIRRSHRVMDEDSYLSARRIREPIKDNHDISNAFDSITYDKGGAVLAMFETYVGEEAFREGVRALIERNSFGHATSADFIGSVAEATELPGIDTAFSSFLEQTGVPMLAVDWDCGADDSVSVQIAQSRYLPIGATSEADRSWKIPTCLRLVDGAESEKRCLMLDEPEALVELQAACPLAVLPNADARGYYRWTLSEPRWRELLEHLDPLSPAERFAVIDNLAADFKAGRVPAELLLEAVPPYAAMEEPDLVTAPLAAMDLILTHLVDDESGSEVRQFLNGLYEPVLDRVGLLPGEDGEATDEGEVASALLRERLVEFLALSSGAVDLREQLRAMGERAIGFGSDGRIGPEQIPDELLGTAIAVALQEHGMPFYEVLVEQFEASDETLFRRRVLEAMGRATDDDVTHEVRGLLASFSLSMGEKGTLFFSMQNDPRSQRALYEWVKEFWDAAAIIIPESAMGYLVESGRGFCSLEDHADVEAFFEPRMAEVEGGPRRLATVLEQIRICSALREYQPTAIRVPDWTRIGSHAGDRLSAG